MLLVTLSLSVFALSAACVGAVPLPGQGYLLTGYDFLFGNPYQNQADPGWRQPIWQFLPSTNPITLCDTSYTLYSHVNGSALDSCGDTYVYNKITTMAEWEAMLLGLDHFAAPLNYSFSASSGWAVTYNWVRSGDTIINNYTECVVDVISINTSSLPKYTSMWESFVREMPIDNTPPSNAWFYNVFIPAFGTHYIVNTTLGSFYGFFNVTSSSGNNIGRYHVAKGVPYSSNPSTWKGEICSTHAIYPVEMHLDMLSNLITNPAKATALKTAIMGYCEFLRLPDCTSAKKAIGSDDVIKMNVFGSF